MGKKHLHCGGLLACLLLSFSFVQLSAQQRTIHGKVTDSKDGTALAGVTIRVKEDPSVGTATSADGTFSLSVPDNAKTLIVSYVGYTTRQVPVSGSLADIQLSSGKSLEEVVVIGYGTQKAKDVSGAVASISTQNFNKGIVTNPIQQIQGKVSGLVITQPGGDPNQSAIIRLRGQTSLTGGQTPLIVVDGVPLDDPSQIADIPPDDIASYDVLKDASATAIYGSRGANGVIIINTKKGQAGKTQVSYTGYVAMDVLAKEYDLLNTSEWKAANTKLGIDPSAIQGYEKGGNTNWLKAITRKAYTQSHNLAFSGGTNNFNYRASLSYINQQGIVINSGKEELGLRFNAEQKALNDKLDIQAGLFSTQTNRKYTDYGNFTYVFSTPPTYPVYNSDGSYFAYNDFEQANPVEHLMEELNTGKEYFTQLYGTINYELVTGLKIGVTGSTTHFNKQTDWFLPTFPVENNINSATKYSENHNVKRGDFHINWMHEWGKHNLTLTGVYEYNDFIYNNYNANGQQYIVEQNQDNALQNGNSAYNSISSYQDEYKLISFLGRAAYNYNSKYYVEASFRRDGSSKFGANNRWGNFPSVSVAWRLSQESFLQNVSWLNDLKLRAGWGITGNQDAISPYNTQLILGSVGKYYNAANTVFPYPQAYAPTQNANPDLKWEERVGRNIGLDFTLFNSRLNGDINVFNDKTKNLLYDYTVPVPPFYVNTILANVGTLTNKGVEISLNGQAIKNSDFSWNLAGQITFIRTKVTSLAGTYAGFQLSTNNIPGGVAEGRGLSSNPITYLKVGYSPYVFYLPHYVGVNAQGQQLFSDGKGGSVTQDKLDNSATANMFHYIDPAPKFNYGLSNTFSYKNWSLNFFLRGVFGQKIFNNTLLDVQNVTRLPGNNVTKEALTNGIKDAAVASDLWLEKASYLRLDNATLAYNFGKIKGVQSLQVYISGNNLFVITPYKGLDPEIRVADSNQSYIDATYGSDGYYPRTRSVSFGVHITFQ
jgi:iron complex outermembrane receptor protein